MSSIQPAPIGRSFLILTWISTRHGQGDQQPEDQVEPRGQLICQVGHVVTTGLAEVAASPPFLSSASPALMASMVLSMMSLIDTVKLEL